MPKPLTAVVLSTAYISRERSCDAIDRQGERRRLIRRFDRRTARELKESGLDGRRGAYGQYSTPAVNPSMCTATKNSDFAFVIAPPWYVIPGCCRKI